MNLHTLPAIDAAPVPPAEDALTRVLADARLRDGAELLDALEARRVELGLANAMVESLAGLAAGHLTKIAGPARSRSPTLASLDRLMMVLGLSFVLVRDPQKVAAARASWKPRHEGRVRQRALSPITVQRARPHVLSELMRRASRPKWRTMPALAFLRALVKENGP